MSNPLVSLLGEKVQNKAKEDVDVASLSSEGGVLGLYFSAHWCGPCRSFTPSLAKFYDNFKKTDEGKKFEIVFLSSDRDESAFSEYFKEMPWLALPFANRDIKEKLSKRFKVRGIPNLVILDSSTGKLITADGRNCVMEDPEGKRFPWSPKPFQEIFTGSILQHDDTEITTESLKGNILGLYFSAHWCPPCRGFTPKLAECYKKVKETHKNFEIIFVSSDSDEEHFRAYWKEMPWAALPFGDARKQALAKHFSISGIPTLVLLDENHKVITEKARAQVIKDPEGKEFPWYPKALNELDDSAQAVINEDKCVILFADVQEDDDVTKAKDVLLPVAEEYKKNEKEEDDKLHFYVAGDEDIVDSLREFLNIKDDDLPILTILDIPEQQVYKCDKKEITATIINECLTKYKEESLEFKPLSG
ncbi:nucleoredoxin-like [Amphiura filiformis]|uniref:nucleoredoxin-like n=1 Tax=Amphiura filiformis TaxID=82378 RepID=UPI003B20C211